MSQWRLHRSGLLEPVLTPMCTQNFQARLIPLFLGGSSMNFANFPCHFSTFGFRCHSHPFHFHCRSRCFPFRIHPSCSIHHHLHPNQLQLHGIPWYWPTGPWRRKTCRAGRCGSCRQKCLEMTSLTGSKWWELAWFCWQIHGSFSTAWNLGIAAAERWELWVASWERELGELAWSYETWSQRAWCFHSPHLLSPGCPPPLGRIASPEICRCCDVAMKFMEMLQKSSADWNPYMIVSEPSKWSNFVKSMCHPDVLQQKDWHSIYTTSTHILLPICGKVSKGMVKK